MHEESFKNRLTVPLNDNFCQHLNWEKLGGKNIELETLKIVNKKEYQKSKSLNINKKEYQKSKSLNINIKENNSL